MSEPLCTHAVDDDDDGDKNATADDNTAVDYENRDLEECTQH